VADGDMGLQIIEIADKTNPIITGNMMTPGEASGIFVTEDYAYIADGDQGLAIIDISQKSIPILFSMYNTQGYAKNVSVSEDFVYIADGESGVCVINVPIPDQPLMGKYKLFDSYGIATDIVFGFGEEEGWYAFIAAGPAGVIAVNLIYED